MKHQFGIVLLFFSIILTSCSSSDDQNSLEKIQELQNWDTMIIDLEDFEYNQIDFGDVVTNITSTKTFSLSNSGNSDLNITNIILPDNFSIDFTTASLPPDQSKEFTLTFVPTEVKDYSAVLEIESNATGGTEKIELLAFGVSPVFDGTVVLTTQEEVDDFGKSGYTSITGGLSIGHANTAANSIVSLESLKNITEVGSLQFFSTTSLENLNGLENLNVTNSIQMVSNIALTNVDALKSITKLTGYLNLLGNRSLKQIDGFQNITEIGKNVRIKNNPKLENIDGLSGLTSIATDFEMIYNPLVETLDGLSNLTSVSLIRLQDNESLYDYCGIVDLLKNKGNEIHFTVSLNETSYNKYNPSQGELVWGNVECRGDVPPGTYHGAVKISTESDIEKFVSKGYTVIDGSLHIYSSRITNLDFLSEITTVTGYIDIWNTALTNLDGLAHMTHIPRISISENEMLSNYCGISTLAQNGSFQRGDGAFFIYDNLFNPSLEDVQNGECSQ
ncbi:choice-of-anchor D domain-containing protein [Maribacter sp. MMG018]|uniref:choice-of-anchor D domain-containing protein n=1 Tax=Maribacter sp. MMG018 TaxID=2822688 RepID=UPI001B371BDA|nr:choice-of-anchor D domain-containing protein [Maribacter sp. MMG018]MBQ4915913.1 choice-of-anchor D domain-containing protein [Maribacter sp. MMG018]